MLTAKSPSEFGIPECPPAGEGCHRWMMSAVGILVRNEIEDDEILELVEGWMTRHPQPGEIENTIRKARMGGEMPQTYIPRHMPDPVAFEKLTAEGPTSFEEIKARSPIDPDGVSLTGILRAVFKPGEKTLIFTNERSQGQLVWSHETRQEDLDRILAYNQQGAWFQLNPVTGDYLHIARLGKSSRRSEENTTSFNHVLVESDKVQPEIWLTILKQLPLPILSITLSGNSSAHALIRVGAKTKLEWTTAASAIARALVPLGACPGSLTAVRLTRLPKVVRRDNQREQSLLFLNPNPSPVPLKNLSVRRA